MPNNFSFSVLKNNQLVMSTLSGWLLFYIVYNIYSIFWRSYIGEYQYDLVDSQVYWWKEWGAWIVITPLLFLVLQKNVQQNNLTSWLFFSLLISIAGTTLIRIVLDHDLYYPELAQAVILILPKYTIAAVLVLLVWYYHYSRMLTNNASVSVEASDALDDKTENYFQVEHLGFTKNIPFEEVFWLSASGNYIELHTKEQTYLLRSTLKNALNLLPLSLFVRVHRSHVVNLSKVSKLSAGENGAAIATLINHQTVNVSKKYKSQFKLGFSNQELH